jgi:hypothetical protein
MNTLHPTCKYSPERVAVIVSAIETGCPAAHAARAAGISDTTFYDWKKEFPEFRDAIAQAESRGMLKRLEAIQKAADSGQWTASAWVLERRFPQLFANQTRDYETGRREGMAEARQEVERAKEDTLGDGYDSIRAALLEAGQSVQDAEAAAKRWLLRQFARRDAAAGGQRIASAETVSENEDAA